MKTQVIKFLRGFGYAFRGIFTAICKERNFRFHLCAGLFVLVLSAFYPFGRAEYLIIILCIAGVMGTELMNTAVERAADKPDGAYSPYAKEAKDIAAGAVLAVSGGAFVCGVWLFWDMAVFHEIALFFSKNLWAAAVGGAYIIASIWFVFGFQKKE
ncbi:MAG: diacylglycerol kinase family protein [Oscillospiraceae bacterium]|nr:diacylglycerol kinase family protein [Oscillospiraceae bacterium]